MKGNLRVSSINFNHKEFYHSEAGTNQADNLLTLEVASKPVNHKIRNYSPDVTFIEQEQCSDLVELGVCYSSLSIYAALWEAV